MAMLLEIVRPCGRIWHIVMIPGQIPWKGLNEGATDTPVNDSTVRLFPWAGTEGGTI